MSAPNAMAAARIPRERSHWYLLNEEICQTVANHQLGDQYNIPAGTEMFDLNIVSSVDGASFIHWVTADANFASKSIGDICKAAFKILRVDAPERFHIFVDRMADLPGGERIAPVMVLPTDAVEFIGHVYTFLAGGLFRLDSHLPWRNLRSLNLAERITFLPNRQVRRWRDV